MHVKNTPPVLLVNMERSTERLARSSATLQRYGLDFVHIKAVDGKGMSIADLGANIAPDFSQYYKVLTTSEVGCYLSHRKCWQYLLNSNFEYVVVLEDDFELQEDISTIHQYLADITLPWDCIKLMEYPLKRSAVQSFVCLNKTLVRYDKIPSRTGAYVVSRSGAKKMLAQSEIIARPVDIDCQYWWENNLMVFGLKPYMVKASTHFESTIDASSKRSNSQKSVIKQLTQKLAFMWMNKKHLKKLINKTQ